MGNFCNRKAPLIRDVRALGLPRPIDGVSEHDENDHGVARGLGEDGEFRGGIRIQRSRRGGPNPAAIYSEFRALILGLDTNAGGAGVIRLSDVRPRCHCVKDIHVSERFAATIIIQANNVLNHFQPRTRA